MLITFLLLYRFPAFLNYSLYNYNCLLRNKLLCTKTQVVLKIWKRIREEEHNKKGS